MQVGLDNAVKLWPTPRANDAEKRGEFDVENPRNGLPAAAKFATPQSRAYRSGQSSRWESQERSYAEAKNFPTPAARDWKDTGTVHTPIRKDGKNRMDTLGRVVADGGQLNSAWVDLLMGWPKDWSGVGPELKQWLNHEGRYSPEALRNGSWEHGVPRVAKGVKNRVARLKALGNGQVPACMVQAWHVLNRIRSENP